MTAAPEPAPAPVPRVGAALILALGALAAIGPMSVDMYLPALPTIGRDFDATPGAVQLTLSAYFAGAALGQLVYGPLSDRFGRRPILIVAIALYVASGALAALSLGIAQLIALRLAQSLGGAVGAVLSRAIVRDISSGDAAARILSLITMVMALAPMLAPLLGGQLLVWLGWRAIFWLLAVFGCACLVAVWFWVPETLPRARRQTLSPGRILGAYLHVLTRPHSLACLLAGGMTFAGMFAYISGTPFVYIEYFGVPPQYFGFLFGLNVLGMMLGAYLNSRLVMRYGRVTMLGVGTVLAGVSGLALLASAVTGFGALLGIVVPLFFYLTPINLVAANAVARLLDDFPHWAGTAAALFGAIQFGLGALAGAAVGQFHDGTPLPMAAVIAVAGVAAFAAQRVLAALER